MHLTLASPEVEHQWLVYARRGHLSEIRSVNTNGGITLYRLPFWHYTTPLAARAGQEARARRWVLLGTFLFPGRPGYLTPDQCAEAAATSRRAISFRKC